MRAREQLGVNRTAVSVPVPEAADRDRKDGETEPFAPDSPRACPFCGSRALQWVESFVGTYGWHARVSLTPRKAKERLIRERQQATLAAPRPLEELKVPP